ncbi:Ig-like domain-containing protein, partial [Bathymodiolus thermophilus thioautotrophic gill symbiont]
TQVNAILNSESDLTISFNENIKTQGGNVEIWNANSKVETIAISNSDINGNILTINPTNDLPEGSFYLKMASGVITDMAGNDAAAITKDNNQWAFEVKALSTSINLTGVSSTDTYINASEKSNAVLSGDLIGVQATVDKIEFYTVTANDVLTLVPDLTITNVVVNSNKHWSQNLSNIEFVDGVTYKARIYLKSGNTEINQYSDAVTFDTSPATLTINAVSTDDKINLS